MIVCVCHAVSDKDIARHALGGCTTFAALQDQTRVATCCGCCEDCAREVHQEALSKRQGVIRIAALPALA